MQSENDLEVLETLEHAAQSFSYYVASLIELISNPDMSIPSGFSDREDYRLHLGNMIGAQRSAIGTLYNKVPGWQSIP